MNATISCTKYSLLIFHLLFLHTLCSLLRQPVAYQYGAGYPTVDFPNISYRFLPLESQPIKDKSLLLAYLFRLVFVPPLLGQF